MIMKIFSISSACGFDESNPYITTIMKIFYVFLSKNIQFRFPREELDR